MHTSNRLRVPEWPSLLLWQPMGQEVTLQGSLEALVVFKKRASPVLRNVSAFTGGTKYNEMIALVSETEPQWAPCFVATETED